jgi:hypothetical protein
VLSIFKLYVLLPAGLSPELAGTNVWFILGTAVILVGPFTNVFTLKVYILYPPLMVTVIGTDAVNA